MKRKLILFDIDGTLIKTGGVAVGVMVESISRVLGLPVQWTIRDFVGNTDLKIIHTLIRRSGGSEAQLDEIAETALNLYLADLKKALSRNSVIKILPGVEKLLKKLKADERFALGLLTGNVREGARIKLSARHLFNYFPVGAFGDDALKREELPPFAIQRAEQHYRCFFDKEDVWIVGDSENDIHCARSNRLKCLAVASGHQPRWELDQLQPAVLVSDLTDINYLLELFSS